MCRYLILSSSTLFQRHLGGKKNFYIPSYKMILVLLSKQE